RPRLVHRKEAGENQARLEFLRQGCACRIQALFPQPGNDPRHLRGLSRLLRRRSRDGHQGFRGRPQDRLPGAAAVGRDRRRRPQQQAIAGRDLAALRIKHRWRQSVAVRTLFVRGSTKRDDGGTARIFRGLAARLTACGGVNRLRKQTFINTIGVPACRQALLPADALSYCHLVGFTKWRSSRAPAIAAPVNWWFVKNDVKERMQTLRRRRRRLGQEIAQGVEQQMPVLAVTRTVRGLRQDDELAVAVRKLPVEIE